jgi:hypothetical protein
MINSAREFTVTDEHLRLLRAAYVGWDDMEFGAPSIDPKRPYGNSDVVADIEVWEEENERRLTQLHRDTETALQIVLVTGSFAAGTYRRRFPYSRDWAAVEE